MSKLHPARMSQGGDEVPASTRNAETLRNDDIVQAQQRCWAEAKRLMELAEEVGYRAQQSADALVLIETAIGAMSGSSEKLGGLIVQLKKKKRPDTAYGRDAG
ncbi:MAG: hypothetical protein U0797_12855 [Gemmataceae bacterium]